MIKKAEISDIKAIHKLLQKYGSMGELLPRPLSELYDHVRDFTVYTRENLVIGCCALQFCWENLAEIRSLAVNPEHTGNRTGSLLVEAAIKEAKTYKIKKIYALTYRPGFFNRFGFIEIERSKLPLKIWTDCVLCVKFPNCDETAMMLEIK